MSAVPPEIDRWNWGAFFLSWIWGLSNGVYISLLVLIPFVSPIMVIVLGAKGSQWAWQKKVWRDVEHFKAVHARQHDVQHDQFVAATSGLLEAVDAVVNLGYLKTLQRQIFDEHRAKLCVVVYQKYTALFGLSVV